jgi:hypothetical protein
MLRELLARRPCAPALGSLVLSTVLATGISVAYEQSIVDQRRGDLEHVATSTASLLGETAAGALCDVKEDNRSAALATASR